MMMMMISIIIKNNDINNNNNGNDNDNNNNNEKCHVHRCVLDVYFLNISALQRYTPLSRNSRADEFGMSFVNSLRKTTVLKWDRTVSTVMMVRPQHTIECSRSSVRLQY